METAYAINSAISELNTIETNDKFINKLFIETILSGDTLDSSDSTDLEVVFEQDWRSAGSSVYSAAAILEKEYYTTSSSTRLFQPLHIPLQNSVINSNYLIAMHPNPANDKITFIPDPPGGSIIKIFDSTGRTMLSRAYVQVLDVSFLEEGLYVVKIFSSEEIMLTKVLIKMQ